MNLIRNSMTALAAVVLSAFATPAARADMFPEWTTNVPVGATLGAGIQDVVVDAAGNTYVTGTAGSSQNSDVLTAAFGPSGALLWSRTFDGTLHGHDQARGIALGPFGEVWVTGNTAGPIGYANVLLLRYDAATGALMKMVQYSSGPFGSEHGASVVVDGIGDVYVGGGTLGNGADAMVLKFDTNGTFVWKRTYDGPAFGPFSQDVLLKVMLDPSNDVVALVHAIMSPAHPDYLVWKLSSIDGAPHWVSNWGVTGTDSPRDMEIDDVGDIYVTGTAIHGTNQYSTVKFDGFDGHVVWQAYDQAGVDQTAVGLALDHAGGVYVTGQADPDGDDSNFNDNVFTVKRDANTGALLWTFAYGANCVGCFDPATDVIASNAGIVFVAASSNSAPYTNSRIVFALDATTGLELDRSVKSSVQPEQSGAGTLRFDAPENLIHAANDSNSNTGAKELSVTKFTTLSQPTHRLEVSELVGGRTASFTVLHATPGAPQFFLLGTTGVATLPVPSFGVTLGLANPLVLFAVPADGTGSFSFSTLVPVGFAGYSAWCQVAEFGSTTPVIHRVLW